MLCAFPIDLGTAKVPCGQCMPCRVNTQRKLCTRLMLEARSHPQSSSFVTLTYSEEEVVEEDGKKVLVREHLDQALDILRKRLARREVPKMRYFAVGEYGSETWRPHYHALIFGVEPEFLKQNELLPAAWGKGFTLATEALPERIRYVAHYTTKKLTSPSAYGLEGRPPEFTRRSKGLGLLWVDKFAEVFDTPTGMAALERMGDVPRHCVIDGKRWPLDHYMRSKLRAKVGFVEPRAAQLDDNLLTWETEPLPTPTPEQEEHAVLMHNKLTRKARRHGAL